MPSEGRTAKNSGTENRRHHQHQNYTYILEGRFLLNLSFRCPYHVSRLGSFLVTIIAGELCFFLFFTIDSKIELLRVFGSSVIISPTFSRRSFCLLEYFCHVIRPHFYVLTIQLLFRYTGDLRLVISTTVPGSSQF
jgi:hypothetical protein